jgi:hypothetical protein
MVTPEKIAAVRAAWAAYQAAAAKAGTAHVPELGAFWAAVTAVQAPDKSRGVIWERA